MTEQHFEGSFVQEAEFTNPGKATWVPELLDRKNWMGHRGKKPFAPWGDRDAPAPCSKHGVTADKCDCDARWKWGFVDQHRTGHDALKRCVTADVDGVAFLQQKGDPYVFVDGDDVRCPDSGRVHPGFAAVLALFGATYCDVSVSKSGVHANYRGDVPGDGTEPSWALDDEPWGANDDVPEIEIYETKHVCVSTGRHVPGTPVAVNEWNADAVEGVLKAVGEYDDPNDTRDSRRSGGMPALKDGDGSEAPDGVTNDMQDVYDAVERLDRRDVAERTIVAEWTDPATETHRAFLPTWGSSSDGGSANFVNEDIWKDKGQMGGYGGPVAMAAIDCGFVNPRNAEPGCVSGAEYAACVQHLREKGFSIPEYKPDGDDGEEDGVEAFLAVAAEYAPDGGDPFMSNEALLVACVKARDAGAVPDDADVPERALHPVIESVTGVDADSGSVTGGTWGLARDVFDALDENTALGKFGVAFTGDQE